jgi:ankyrin repeat protein
LSRGADPNADDVAKRKTLMYAVTTEMAELLIEYGTKLDCKDCFGDSLLHLSCTERRPTVMTQFFSKYIYINTRNRYGETALHTACEWLDINNVRMLLELGCDPDIADYEGCKAVEITPSREIKDFIDAYEVPFIKCALDDS